MKANDKINPFTNTTWREVLDALRVQRERLDIAIKALEEIIATEERER